MTGIDQREASVGRGVRGFSGATLRRVRIAQNLTIDDLAAAVEVSESTIRRWELGLALPMPHNLRAGAVALGIDVIDLLVNRISATPTLKDLRAVAALTLDEVAQRSQLSRSSLLRLERGSMHLGDISRLTLAEVYDVDEDQVESAYAESVSARLRRSLERRAQASSG